MDISIHAILAAIFAFFVSVIIFSVRRAFHVFRLRARSGTKNGGFVKEALVFLAWFVTTFTLSYLALLFLQSYTPQVLRSQNQPRLEAWEDNGCVAPETITKSVFLVTNKSMSFLATGFKLEGGVLVSNRHVAEALPEPLFVSSTKEKYEVSTLHIADSRTRPDLAFFTLPETMATIPSLPLAKEVPRYGDFLLIVGNNKHRKRFYPTVVRAIKQAPVSGLTYVSDSIYKLYNNFSKKVSYVDKGSRATKRYNLHGDTAGGNSGSPVVNCSGEVVGVYYASRAMYWFAGEQKGLAVVLQDLRLELKELPANDAPTPPLT